MGMKEINPLQNVSFYRTCNSGTEIRIVKKELDEISNMMPEQAQTTVLRCFVKNDEQFAAAKNAFKAFCLDKLGSEPIRNKELSHSQMREVLLSQSAILSQ